MRQDQRELGQNGAVPNRLAPAATGPLSSCCSEPGCRCSSPAIPEQQGQMRRAESVTLRRNAEGWSVEADGTPVDSAHDLLLAMTVADLLIDELQPKRRPVVVASDDTELDRLRTVVAQLEHALSARIVVERAIGVLAERLGLTPTEAFGRLRSTARSGGRRVHDLATDVVASVTSDVKLPPSLS